VGDRARRRDPAAGADQERRGVSSPEREGRPEPAVAADGPRHTAAAGVLRQQRGPQLNTTVRRREDIMRLWDHLWAGVLVSLALGAFLIGGAPYLFAWQQQLKREQERQLNEQVTGGKIPPPTQDQAARDWQHDLATGAGVGGVIWCLGVVAVFWGAWKNRRRGLSGQSGVSPDEGQRAEPT
jgi:hypothetical protein